jgi:hypothetical protein
MYSHCAPYRSTMYMKYLCYKRQPTGARHGGESTAPSHRPRHHPAEQPDLQPPHRPGADGHVEVHPVRDRHVLRHRRAEVWELEAAQHKSHRVGPNRGLSSGL